MTREPLRAFRRSAHHRAVNELLRSHLEATYFREYQELRDELLAILTDEDLARTVGGGSLTLGFLCREIGEIEHAYVESFLTFRQDFGYRNPDPELERSVRALATWYAELDRDLMAALEGITEDDVRRPSDRPR